MPWREQAALLFRKARQDRVVVARSVADEEIADEIVGFHVQQAAEKCMKAVLALNGIPYRRTHDLQELYDLLEDNHIAVPGAVVELVDWSPFAVAYRYEDWLEPEPVDRTRGLTLVDSAIEWVEREISAAPGATP